MPDPSPTPSPTPVPVKPNAMIIAALKSFHEEVTSEGHVWKDEETKAYEKALKHAEAWDGKV